MLTGELSAGSYEFTVNGVQESNDAHLHAVVALRKKGLADQTLATGDGGMVADGGSTALDLKFTQPPLCGDELVITLTLLSGSSGYIELSTSLTIP